MKRVVEIHGEKVTLEQRHCSCRGCHATFWVKEDSTQSICAVNCLYISQPEKIGTRKIKMPPILRSTAKLHDIYKKMAKERIEHIKNNDIEKIKELDVKSKDLYRKRHTIK